MPERFGTIFECDGKKAVRHKVPQAEWQTVCGLDLYYKVPDIWGNVLKPGWNIEHEIKKEIRCKKCYPKPKKRKTWLTSSKKK